VGEEDLNNVFWDKLLSFLFFLGKKIKEKLGNLFIKKNKSVVSTNVILVIIGREKNHQFN